MFFFPLVNFLFLIILYFIHKRVFLVTAFLEAVVYMTGTYLIYEEFATQSNQFLYMLFLTGVGFIIALVAFFIAILLNQHKLYGHNTNE